MKKELKHKYLKNSDFGTYITPLVRPMYVLQMARSKRWSPEARLKHISNLRAACVEVIKRIDRNMEMLCEAANEDYDKPYTTYNEYLEEVRSREEHPFDRVGRPTTDNDFCICGPDKRVSNCLIHGKDKYPT